MTEKDLDYVVSVLKGEKTSVIPDWFSVMGFLIGNRIGGLFYNRAKSVGIFLPKKIETLLADIFNRQKRRVCLMREYLKIISERLKCTGVEYSFLKGSVLCNISFNNGNLYVDGERTSNDIDILVEQSGLSEINRSLADIGFIQGKYDAENNKIEEFSRLEIINRRLNRGEVAPFIKLTGNSEIPFIEIDVNFSLGNTPTEGKEVLSLILRYARDYGGKLDLRVADKELFFLHLIMHQYKESCVYFMVERSKDLDFYKLADIYYYVKADILDWDVLKRIIKDYQLEQQTGTVLWQVGEAFADENILNLSETFSRNQPRVIDYGRKKKYEWSVGIRKRICEFNNAKYLKEIKP